MAVVTVQDGAASIAATGTGTLTTDPLAAGAYAVSITLDGALNPADSVIVSLRGSIDGGLTAPRHWKQTITSADDVDDAIVSFVVPLQSDASSALLDYDATVGVGPILFHWSVYKLTEIV